MLASVSNLIYLHSLSHLQKNRLPGFDRNAGRYCFALSPLRKKKSFCSRNTTMFIMFMICHVRNTTMFILNLAFADLLYCVTNIPMYSILVRNSLQCLQFESFLDLNLILWQNNQRLQFFHRGWPWSATTCTMFAITK